MNLDKGFRQNSKEFLEIMKFLEDVSERIKLMDQYLTIDRFEENYAICENRETGEIVNVDIKELPINVAEGDIIKYNKGKYEIDLEKQEEIEKRIQEKMEKVFGGKKDGEKKN